MAAENGKEVHSLSEKDVRPRDEKETEVHPLIRSLLKDGAKFSFFQAVRLLQILHPEAVKVGYQGPVERECIRFSASTDLAFADSDVSGVEELKTGDATPRYQVTTNFLGVYGPASPLPNYYTEQVIQAEEESLERQFVDLFHHRAVSIFYRVWEKYRHAVQFQTEGKDYYSKRLLALLNLSPEMMPPDHSVEPMRFLTYAGMLSQQPRSAYSLRGILSHYFSGIDVNVDSCVGQWLPISADQQNRLAVKNSRLGADLNVGDRIFDMSGTFRTTLGPMGLEDFIEFLPTGAKMKQLREIVDLFVPDNLDYEVELRIRRDEIPDLKLSAPTARLGWCTWLGRRDAFEVSVRFLEKGWLHG